MGFLPILSEKNGEGEEMEKIVKQMIGMFFLTIGGFSLLNQIATFLGLVMFLPPFLSGLLLGILSLGVGGAILISQS